MIRRPPRSTQSRSSAASDVYKRQHVGRPSRSTDVYSRARQLWLEGRSTAREVLLSGKPRSIGPVDRVRSRSTESIDRHAQACTPSLAGGPVDRQRASAIWKAPVDQAGRPAESVCSLFQATVDRGSNGQKSDHWWSTGPVDRQPSGLLIWPQRLVFEKPI